MTLPNETASNLLQHELELLGFLDKENEKSISSLLESARIENYPPQSVLYRENDQVDTVFLIQAGLVKMLNFLPNGRSRIVRLHNRGSMIGLSGVMGESHDHTAISIAETVAFQIPLKAMLKLKEIDSTSYAKFLEKWYEYINQADTWITEFSTGAVRARIARLILFLAEFEPEGTEKEVRLLSSEEMADILGVTPESVSRVVAEFKRQNYLVTINDQETYTCHRQELMREAEE